MLAAALALGSLAGATLATPFFSPVDAMNLFSRNAQISSGCSTSGPASCHNTTKETNLCCFESPGGLLLQTQFWDTDPSTGPSDSWTIHGLWPDNCDGTFSENCDASRDYTNIAGLLTAQGAADTLSFMQEYWVDINGQNEQFWEHEWSTHGTCYSTLKTSCLPSGSAKGAEAVSFFNTVVALFKTLPTYDWLSSAGITPSSSKTYTLSQITSAVQSAHGFIPALNCDSSTTISQISYYFNLKGSLLDGTFVPIDTPEKGTCASSGLKYIPKSGSGSSSPTTSAGGSSPSGTGGLPSKAHLQASTTGALLTAGTWSTQTPATYTISGSPSGFTLSTSKGKCAVSSGTLACGSSVSTASTFTAVTSGSQLLLAFQGSTAWTSDSTPSGTDQETVFTGTGHSVDYTIAIVST
ncbi:ribonuclease T2-like protein [Phanerochaete sordida]|uniref:Ribonuclease T2-like n=1 Tax=Phanerochaete sordida TaxID=48140 RepID=A0A9P3G7F0_9APHY|nr:ribonuclease T2-like protein [Phanerochaete sordida]